MDPNFSFVVWWYLYLKVVSEAVAFLLYLWCAALGNVAGDYNSDFGSPRVLTTNRGKVIDQWDANPWKEDMSQKVKGTNLIAGKGFFVWKKNIG